MAPGRKLGTSKHTPAEAPMCEYEKLRAQNMLRNSLALQRLGVSAAYSLVNNSIVNMPNRKTGKASACEHSDPSYEPEDEEDKDDDDTNQGLVDKVSVDAPSLGSTRNMSTCRGGPGVSKRVMAPDEQDQPARRTRQRTRELSTTDNHEGSGHDELFIANCSAEPENQIQIGNEGQTSGIIDRWNRGCSMGKELDRMSRGLSIKLPVTIAEGMKRPEAPMQAAKLASETGIIVRQQIPILPHWKAYKKDKSHFDNYMGKIAGRFTIDRNNDAVKNACTDLLRTTQRQLRYRLKKMYFDGIPANEVRTTSPLVSMTDEQWRDLVEMWSNPKHKEKCAKNKGNREKVVFQQKTGSRCFVAHCHAVKQDKYKDVSVTPIDLFKEYHCSSKTGLAEPVKKEIADMEAMMTEPTKGQVPNSAIEIFSEVLPRSKFLQTAGIVAAAPKKNGKAVVSSRVQELESELEAEKREAAALREQLDAQQLEMGDLKKQVQNSNAQIETLKQQAVETDIILRKLLMLHKV